MVGDFGNKFKPAKIKTLINDMTTQSEKNQRSPIVVIMGHVDHGKTTLLDFIRKTSVAAKEAGGITQSIGAYEIDHNGHRLTFIDTPGHEAFSKMRSRGTQAADIAILVVAADDGVQPQTKEAIKIIKDAKIPFVVAINKTDVSSANVDNVKNELMHEEVLLEGYGGNVSFVPLSAKTGAGVNDLLDLIMLVVDAELTHLTYDSQAPAEGFILEAKMDNRQGIIVSAIVKNGVLKVGDEVAAGTTVGKVKMLKDFLGQKINEAIPSSPVLILGFESLPEIGAKLVSGQGMALVSAAPTAASDAPKIASGVPMNTKDGTTINLILKGDVSGSVEALTEIITNLPLPEKISLRIIDAGVGEIGDGDVQSAVASKAIIVGFRTKISRAAATLSKAQSVEIIASEIVYELVKTLEGKIALSDRSHIKADLEVLAIFGKRQTGEAKKSSQQIVGGKITMGAIKNNAALEIERRDKNIGQGKIVNLQQNHKDATEVAAGNEAGMLIDADVEIKVGDHLVIR